MRTPPQPRSRTSPRIAGLRSLILLAGVGVGASAAVAAAATSEITVTRETRDLYRIDGTNRLIKTQGCHEYAAFAEEAILSYEQDSGENTLYFVYSGATCEVERLLTDE